MFNLYRQLTLINSQLAIQSLQQNQTMIQKINKTQLLIHPSYHHQHRGKITDKRHNITAKSFFTNKYPRSLNKQNIRQKNEQPIIAEVSAVKNKVNTSKSFANNKLQQVGSTEQFKRYPPIDNNHTQPKILQNDEFFKFVFPSNQNLIDTNKQNRHPTLFSKKYSLIEKSYKKFESHSVSKETQELKSTKQKQMLYNLPQRNEKRSVIFKKTLVLSSMQSCLLELSLLDERLLITAYLMGVQNTTLRQFYSLKKTHQILRDYQNNYEALCNRIIIQKPNNKYQMIKLMPLKQQTKERSVEEDKSKQRSQIQKEFIKRNFYTVTRGEEQIKSERCKPKISHTHMQAIVQRLAGTKKYNIKQSKLDSIEHQDKTRSSANRQVKSKLPPKPQLIHIHKRVQLQDFKNPQPVQDQIEQIRFQETKQHPSPAPRKASQQSNKQIQNVNVIQRQEQVNVNNEQVQYEQQFDNPSQFKVKQSHHSQQKIHNEQKEYEDQFDSSKIELPSRLITEKKKQDLKEVNEYEDNFENNNQYEQQVYQQLFQASKVSKNKQVVNKASIQQYQQSFQT